MMFQLVLWSEQAMDQNPGNAVQQILKLGISHHQSCVSPSPVQLANPFSQAYLYFDKGK